MIRQPSRRAVMAVRTVKAAATALAAGVALALTLGAATADPGDASDTPDGTAPLVERVVSDARCADAAGKTLVQTRDGATRAVSFEHGWRIYRGERPGTLVAVCPD